MARDVEFNVTADDRTGTALAAAERHFAESQKRIDKINKEHADKRQHDLDVSAAKIGRRLESVFGQAAPKLAQSLARTFASAGEAAGPVMVGAVIGSLPFLGAAISGAVIGGVGLGGVAGGMYLASKDPAVAAATEAFSSRFGERLSKSARTSFSEPMIEAIGDIEAALGTVDFDGIFRNASKFVDPLTRGVSKFIERVGDGVEALTRKAGPVIEEIAEGTAAIGDEIGDFFETMSENGVSAAVAVDMALKNLALTIRVVSVTVDVLAKTFGFLAQAGAFGQHAQTEYLRLSLNAQLAATSTDSLANATKGLVSRATESSYAWSKTGEAYDRTNQYLADSEKAMEDAARAADALTNSNRSLYDSETGVGRAIDAATKARKENGKTLDASTEKGRANRDALSAVAKAAKDEYDAFVKVNNEGPKSVALGDKLRSSFIQTAQSFGLSKTAANQLADSILGIPSKKNVSIEAKSNAATVSKETKDALNSIHSKTVSVNVQVNASRLASIENRLNRLGGSMYNAAGQSWAALDTNSGVARTGGPTPVSVSNNISVALDGSPFYAMTALAVQERSDRDAWRQKVGKR